MRRSFTLLAVLLASCGGAATTDPAPSSPPQAPQQAPGDAPGGSGAQTSQGACADAAQVEVPAGGTVARPAGSALRLVLVYQGSTIGVARASGVDMVLPQGDGPLVAGKNSGYWAELRGGDDRALFTRVMQDPTRLEVPPPPGGGAFTNTTADRCAAKTMTLDVPNDPRASAIVIFGSPYGTQGPASEIARFTVR